MKVKPFRGVRPRKDLAAEIASPPYDVLDSEEARRAAEGNPYSFLRVIKPEIDLEPGTSPYDDRVYETGRMNFAHMLDEGWMVRDESPAFYIYRLEMGDHDQTGIVGVAAVDDYLGGRIKKHELTRRDKETDRVRHIEALSAQTGPLILTYRRVPELSAVVSGITAREPDVDIRTPEDDVRHALWVVSEAAACDRIETLFAKVPFSYIADGHHRAEAAAQVAVRRRAANPEPTGDEPHDFFLTVHFPSQQLRILDYNRLVRDLNGLEPGEFLDRVRKAGFDVKENHRTRRPPHRRSYGMYLGGHWFLLTAKGEPLPESDPARGLDVAVLSERLLGPVLGIGDIRTDRRIDFVGGIRGMDELERRVDSGEYAVAFAVHPPAMEEVMKIADAGCIMPPKSTWFEPKLRSGLVVHTL